jgi:hypothetical protein
MYSGKKTVRVSLRVNNVPIFDSEGEWNQYKEKLTGLRAIKE